MKFFKRANLYKASNVSFNPETCEARSYEWWAFTKMINGVLVFNDHTYSPSTAQHQNKVRRLLSELKIGIDLVVDARCGLQSDQWPAQAMASIESDIKELKDKLSSPKRKKALDEERLEALNRLEVKKHMLSDFIASLPQ